MTLICDECASDRKGRLQESISREHGKCEFCLIHKAVSHTRDWGLSHYCAASKMKEVFDGISVSRERRNE